MFNKEERIVSAVREDRKILQNLEGKVETIKGVRLTEIESLYNGIKARIKELQDKKHDVIREPINKEEFLKGALHQLNEERRDAFKSILQSTLEAAHLANTMPFSVLGLKRKIERGENLGKLVFLCITGEDLKEAVASLPDIGISNAEREAKIKEIDNEIAGLSSRLEKEFRKIPSLKGEDE